MFKNHDRTITSRIYSLLSVITMTLVLLLTLSVVFFLRIEQKQILYSAANFDFGTTQHSLMQLIAARKEISKNRLESTIGPDIEALEAIIDSYNKEICKLLAIPF